MSLISVETGYLDNSLEAIMDLKTGCIVYFVNNEAVDLDVISKTNIPLHILLTSFGVELAYEKQILDNL